MRTSSRPAAARIRRHDLWIPTKWRPEIIPDKTYCSFEPRGGLAGRGMAGCRFGQIFMKFLYMRPVFHLDPLCDRA
jgi:hypothetical protein